MAKQTIAVGSSPNYGDGDPLRTAFTKVNANFDELYAGQNIDPGNTGASLMPDADGTRDLGAADKQWADLYVKDYIYLNGTRIEVDSGGVLRIGGGIQQVIDVVGSVFADDSTLLVDGVNGTIPGYISIDELKSAVSASGTYAEFVAYINNL